MSFSSDHTTLYYLLKLFTSENLTVRKGDPLPPFWCYVSNTNAVMHSGENSHMWKRLICCSAIGWYSTEAGISNCSVQPLSILRCALVRTLDHFSCDLTQSLQKYSRIMCSRKRKLILSLFTFWKEDLFMLKGQSSRNIGGQFCSEEACRYMLPYFASKSSWDSSRLFHHNLFTINSYSPSYSAMVLHLLKFVNFHVLQTPTKSDQTRVFIPFIFAWDKLIYIYGVNDLLERYGYS